MRLYYRVYDLFPSSPLAGRGRSTLAPRYSLQWNGQMYMTAPLPRRERDAYLEGHRRSGMKLVIKKFPGTKMGLTWHGPSI